MKAALTISFVFLLVCRISVVSAHEFTKINANNMPTFYCQNDTLDYSKSNADESQIILHDENNPQTENKAVKLGEKSVGEDTISFGSDISTRNFHLFDSKTESKSITLYWLADLSIDPPYLRFKEVRIFISQFSPDSNFVEIFKTNVKGSDSLKIENLTDGTIYFLRAATIDSLGKINSLSKPIMTIPNQQEIYSYSIQAPQIEKPMYYVNLAWSRDSKKIAFIKNQDNYTNLFLFDVSAKTTKKLTNYSNFHDDGRLFGLDWTPDNQWISYTYTPTTTFYLIDYSIYVISVSDVLNRKITSGRLDASGVWVNNHKLLYMKGIISSSQIPEFYTIDISGDNIETQLTHNQLTKKFSPSVSQIKNLVAFSGSQGGMNCIYLMGIDGNNLTPLTQNKYWMDIHPFWSSSGDEIYFTSKRSGHYEIWSINVESKKLKQITHSNKIGVNRYYGRPSYDGNNFAVLEIGDKFSEAVIRLHNKSDVRAYSSLAELPTNYSLSQNYPNPFNPETIIQYTIPAVDAKFASATHVTLKVFDVLGREVASLVDEYKNAGNYKVTFNVKTLRATSLPSGVYFYRLRSGSYSETKKLILLK